MSDKPTVHLSAHGFKGHGCVFCGVAIPVDEPDQFPLRIVLGGRTTHLWAHRTCMHQRVTEQLSHVLERLPPATPDDVWPDRQPN